MYLWYICVCDKHFIIIISKVQVPVMANDCENVNSDLSPQTRIHVLAPPCGVQNH